MSQNSIHKEEEAPLPVSLLFLKTVVGALGVVLVAGFVFVIGILLLGGKYFAEQAEFEPYKLAKRITLSPLPQGTVISVKTSPVGVEVLSQNEQGQLILTVYDGETGKEFSEVTVK